jgi:GLPGLI family protein
MKKYLFIATLFFLLTENTTAQIFIDKASIEFEVKSNVKKSMGNGAWAERMEDKLPVFKTEIYNYTFADNKSIYKFNRLLEKEKFPEWMRNENKNSWFTDFNAGKINVEKDLIGSMFNIEDSIPKLEWRIINENRIIAGFNCKKAVTKIFDSVYVFAFYTDEIMIPGGPNSISGLPGMIMGLTIPRLFTSWIATKVSVNGLDLSTIKPTIAKKYYNNQSLHKLIVERTKDWWSGGEESEENKQQRNRFIWGMML